jgi:hypothetical protein
MMAKKTPKSKRKIKKKKVRKSPNLRNGKKNKKDTKSYDSDKNINHKKEKSLMSLDKNVDNKKEEKSSDLKKKLYAVLTYQKSTGEMCHINRDVNAVKNMKIITETLLTTKKRPKEYCRNSSTNHKTKENLMVGEEVKSVKKVLNKKKSQKYVKVKKVL